MKNRLITRRLVYPLAGIIMMVIAIVVVSIQAASLGSELVQIENQIRMVESENRKIMTQTIEGTSLTRINVKARDLGMIKPSDVYYLGQETSQVAQLP